MLIKGIIVEDFVNYKKPCMTIEFPFCDFKCDKENGTQLCQNYSLQFNENIDISIDTIVGLYIKNTITQAIVLQGLEPLYDVDTVIELITFFRKYVKDDIVIYTGYTEDEIPDVIKRLSNFSNIIIKFGRYRPNNKPHYDEVLGVELASDNQYAVKL